MKVRTIMSEKSEVKVLSPYAAAGYVNTQLKEAGLEKRIPPQMMYNYTTARVRAGKKPFITWTPEEGVNRESLEKWTAAYVAKQKAALVTESE